MKKTVRIFVVALAVLLLMACMTACELPLPDEGEALAETVQTMVDAIVADDADTVKAQLSEKVDLTSFDETFASWKTLLAGVDTYEFQAIGWKKSLDNGVSSFELTGRIESESGTLLVQAKTVEGELVSFVFSTEDAKTEGGIAGVVSIVMYVITGLSVALVVLMVIDCARRRLNAKALWIILILIGHLELYATKAASGLSMGFHIGAIVPFSSYTVYESGAFDWSLLIPVGAIVYFFLRKWLTAKYEAPVKPVEDEYVVLEEGAGTAGDAEKSENPPMASQSEETPREDEGK